MEPFVMLIMIFAFFFIVFVFAKILGEHIKNANSPILEERAIVVAKRTSVSGTSEGSSTSYYITFEFENGSRRELHARGSQYGIVAEGDRGILKSQGTKLLSFERLASSYAQAPATDETDAWHKCEACGATFKGSVCDYCGTHYTIRQ